MNIEADLGIKLMPENYDKHDLIFKTIVVGDSKVGKSSLTMRAVKDLYMSNKKPTIGFELTKFNLIVNDKAIKLQIWDTCGQERFRSLIKCFYQNSQCAIIVFSIDK